MMHSSIISDLDLLSNAFETIKEMMSDRGFNIEPLQRYSKEELNVLMESQSLDFALDEGVLIIISMAQKTKALDFQNRVRALNKPLKQLILVTRAKLTASTQKATLSAVSNRERIMYPIDLIQFFNLTQLQINVSRHSLVPKHELIQDEETVRSIMKIYGLKSRSEFTRISHLDAQAYYLGARPENLIKVSRITPSAGIHEVFRICF
jgi:DNA-directed RNA polymerase I, II, and III subunit RPABC1